MGNISDLIEESKFKIRMYSRSELAQAYDPSIAPESAVRKLNRMLREHSGLLEELLLAGYKHGSHFFTSRQVSIIVNRIGTP